MTINDIVALGAVILSIGTNVVLYAHLGSTMNARFDSIDRRFDAVDRHFESVKRRLEMIQGSPESRP